MHRRTFAINFVPMLYDIDFYWQGNARYTGCYFRDWDIAGVAEKLARLPTDSAGASTLHAHQKVRVRNVHTLKGSGRWFDGSVDAIVFCFVGCKWQSVAKR